MVEPNDSIKLLLEAFQMSVSACLAHPTVPMLHAQLSGRLQLTRSMSAKVCHCALPFPIPKLQSTPKPCTSVSSSH